MKKLFALLFITFGGASISMIQAQGTIKQAIVADSYAASPSGQINNLESSDSFVYLVKDLISSEIFEVNPGSNMNLNEGEIVDYKPVGQTISALRPGIIVTVGKPQPETDLNN